MPVIVWVALGGGVGAMARYGVNQFCHRLLGSGFPWQTVIENVLGSFLMGLITGLAATKLNLPDGMKAFITVGILGGFTTFSTFSLDFANLTESKQLGAALFYAALSVFVSLAAVFAGLSLGRS